MSDDKLNRKSLLGIFKQITGTENIHLTDDTTFATGLLIGIAIGGLVSCAIMWALLATRY